MVFWKKKAKKEGLAEPLLGSQVGFHHDLDLDLHYKREIKTDEKPVSPEEFWNNVYEGIEGNCRHEVTTIISEAFTRTTKLPSSHFVKAEIPVARVKEAMIKDCEDALVKIVKSTNFIHGVKENKMLQKVVLLRFIYELEKITKPEIENNLAIGLATELKTRYQVYADTVLLDALNDTGGSIKEALENFRQQKQDQQSPGVQS